MLSTGQELTKVTGYIFAKSWYENYNDVIINQNCMENQLIDQKNYQKFEFEGKIACILQVSPFNKKP